MEAENTESLPTEKSKISNINFINPRRKKSGSLLHRKIMKVVINHLLGVVKPDE